MANEFFSFDDFREFDFTAASEVNYYIQSHELLTRYKFKYALKYNDSHEADYLVEFSDPESPNGLILQLFQDGSGYKTVQVYPKP